MFKSLLCGLRGEDEDFYRTQLQPMSEPICATEPKFCLPNPVTLKLQESVISLYEDDFKIYCIHTGTPYFRCYGKPFGLGGKRVLLDHAGMPVANLKEHKLFSCADKYHIYAWDNSFKKICSCNASSNFFKAKLTVDFPDVAVSGKMRHVVLKGDWRDKYCIIYLGEPKQGGIPIAKVFRPSTATARSSFLGLDVYHLEIAAGVDVAMMVLICMAFDKYISF